MKIDLCKFSKPIAELAIGIAQCATMIAEPEIALAGLAKGISGSDIAFAKCANAIAGSEIAPAQVQIGEFESKSPFRLHRATGGGVQTGLWFACLSLPCLEVGNCGAESDDRDRCWFRCWIGVTFQNERVDRMVVWPDISTANGQRRIVV